MATRFNVKPQHIKYVKALITGSEKFGRPPMDEVIIHGDGQIFASMNHEKVDYRDENGKRSVITKSQFGSRHHRQFNGGFDDAEATSIARYFAVFHPGDKLPETPEDLIQAFYEQQNKELEENNQAVVKTGANILTLEDEEEKAPAGGKDEKAVLTAKIDELQAAKEEADKGEDEEAKTKAAEALDAAQKEYAEKFSPRRGGRPKK